MSKRLHGLYMYVKLHLCKQILYCSCRVAYQLHRSLLCTFRNLQVYTILLFFSDEVYLLKIIIAIIDHNHHIKRDYRKSNSGEIQHHRVWRRRSQHWDAVPKKVKKNYAYVPEILLLIFRYREQMDQPLRNIKGRKRIGSTITPPSTSEIVKKNKSPFSGDD